MRQESGEHSNYQRYLQASRKPRQGTALAHFFVRSSRLLAERWRKCSPSRMLRACSMIFDYSRKFAGQLGPNRGDTLT